MYAFKDSKDSSMFFVLDERQDTFENKLKQQTDRTDKLGKMYIDYFALSAPMADIREILL